MILNAPFEIVSISITLFVVGLGLYLGLGMTVGVNLSTGANVFSSRLSFPPFSFWLCLVS